MSQSKNQYRIEQRADQMPVFRIYINGRKTSAFIPFPHGRQSVPVELYSEAEAIVDKSIF